MESMMEKLNLKKECATCSPEKYLNVPSGSTVPICEKHWQERAIKKCEHCFSHHKSCNICCICHTAIRIITPSFQERVEEEFDEKFLGKKGGIYMPENKYNEIKQFISSALSTQKKLLLKSLPGKRENCGDSGEEGLCYKCEGFNSALDIVRNKIKLL